MVFLNLNSCYGHPAAALGSNASSTPNIWENPSLTGIHRLPPHSRNVANMADDYRNGKQDSSGQIIPPCVCLDSSALESDVQSDVTATAAGWQFRLFKNPNCIPLDYIMPSPKKDLVFCTNKVSIPHNWTMMPCHRKKLDDNNIQQCGCQLSDPPRYTNVRMPFDTLYPHVPLENPAGVYRLQFAMDTCAWNSRRRQRMVLHLGAVESCFFVYLNGQFVGMGKDSRLPNEFDVTSCIHCNCFRCKQNDNILTIVALKWSDGSFLEQQDHWRGMGGIHRSVYLYALPSEAYIEDVFCRASVTEKLDEEKTEGSPQSLFKWKGKIQVEARIGRDSNTRVDGRDMYYNDDVRCLRPGGIEYRMLFQLYDCKGDVVFDEPLDVTDTNAVWFSAVNLRSNLVSFDADVPGSVLAWSDEQPTLYLLEATLFQVDTSEDDHERLLPVDTFRTRIGFRSIKIANRQLLINGQPVLIKGVNRHDHSPIHGKAVTCEEIARDLTLMKEHNFNAIRTAHYPNDPYLYDLADELGLYVIDEANIECHGHYDMICREHSFAAAMLDRVQRMVIRDQNHPCIIGFSIGNEAGFSHVQTTLYGWIKGYDSSRFVQYEGANRPIWGQHPHVYDRKESLLGTDIICPMYPSIDEMMDWAQRIAPGINEQRPMILCEYAHAMGNSSGSLSDYWLAIKSTHGLQGGFIWDWVDQGIMEIDSNGTKWFAYGGDYGDNPHDANFNINGMVSADRQPHPAMIEHKKIGQQVDFALEYCREEPAIRVYNRQYFSHLNNLKVKWMLKVGGFVRDEGYCPLPGVPPQSSFVMSIDELTRSMKNNITMLPSDVEVHLDVKAVSIKLGHEVAVEQFVIRQKNPTLNQINLPKLIEISSSSVDVNEHELNYSITSDACELQMSHETLDLKYSCNSRGALIEGLRINLFRAGTDNDGVKQFGMQFDDKSKPLGNWLSMGLDSLSFEAKSMCSGNVTVPIGQTEDTEFPAIVSAATIMGRPGYNKYKEIPMAQMVSSTQPIMLGNLEQSVAMLNDGSLFVNIKIHLDETFRDLPRVGLELSIPEKFEEAWYFANGPHENYPDRKYSAHSGVYHEIIPHSLDTYVVPQEQGNRTGLRWVLLAERSHEQNGGTVNNGTTTPHTIEDIIDNKTGLLIIPTNNDNQFTLLRYTDAQVFAARHSNDLTSSSSIYVHLDAAQRGLGSGSCGPQTLPEYQVNGGLYDITFFVKPVKSKTS